MDIMTVAIGMDPGSASGGTAGGALFVALFAAAGFILLFAGGRLLRRGEPRAKYSTLRL